MRLVALAALLASCATVADAGSPRVSTRDHRQEHDFLAAQARALVLLAHQTNQARAADTLVHMLSSDEKDGFAAAFATANASLVLPAPASRLEIVVFDETSSAFSPRTVEFSIDGIEMPNIPAKGLGSGEVLPIFSGQVLPGKHELAVGVWYDGSAKSLKGYSWRLRDELKRSLTAGETVKLVVHIFLRDSHDLAERPKVEFEVSTSAQP